MDSAQWLEENKEVLADKLRAAVEAFLQNPTGYTSHLIERHARNYYVASRPAADKAHAEEQERLGEALDSEKRWNENLFVGCNMPQLRLCETPLFRVCYDNEQGMRRFDRPYCEACAREFIGGEAPRSPEHWKISAEER